jgi:hypothetical protein
MLPEHKWISLVSKEREILMLRSNFLNHWAIRRQRKSGAGIMSQMFWIYILLSTFGYFCNLSYRK